MKNQSLGPQSDYSEFLRECLENRIRGNARYSLRSFARDLGIAAPNLSLILRHKKGLSLNSAARVAIKLGLSDQESALFCDLVAVKHTRSKAARRIVELRLNHQYSRWDSVVGGHSAQQLSVDAFRIISDWYHYALLELSLTKGFKNDPAWIARRLNISIHEVNGAIERLRRLDLIRLKKGKLAKIEGRILSTDGVPSEAIRKFNRQVLTKAVEALASQNVDERDFITMTLAGNPAQLMEAGQILRRGCEEVTAKLEEGETSEVFCVSMQIFKLSYSKEKL